MFSVGDKTRPLELSKDSTGKYSKVVSTSSPRSQLSSSENMEAVTLKIKEQQNALETGVAQIANIGSIISFTFGAFNEKFTRFDEIIDKAVHKTDDIGGEFKKQAINLQHVQSSVDTIQEQMRGVISAVRKLELHVANQIIRAPSGKLDQAEIERLEYIDEIKEKENLLLDSKSAALRVEREELLQRIGDLEEQMTSIKYPPIKLEKEKADLDLSLMRDNLLKTISGIDSQLLENDGIIKSRPTTAQMRLRGTDIISGTESLDFHSNDRMGALERALQAQETIIEKLNKAMESSVNSASKSLLDAQNLQAHALEEKNALASARRKSIEARLLAIPNDYSSASINERHEIVIEELQTEVGLLRNELSAETDRRIVDNGSASMLLEENIARILHLEDTIKANKSSYLARIQDLSERLTDLQDGAQSTLGSSLAIKRLQLAMNDVIAEVDELKYKQASNNDAIEPEDIDDSMLGLQHHQGTASIMLELEISSVKNQLLELRDNLDNGLDTYADAHAADPDGGEAFESEFIARVAEFADRLDNVISSFHSKETPELTLIALFNPLDALTIELEALFELDEAAVASMGITFDDISAEGNSRNVRDTMKMVWEASLPLLDHKVTKITMRRRLAALEGSIKAKADLTVLSSLEAELRRLVTAKADQKELLAIASKKVSLGELQRLKDQLMKQIVSIRGFEHNHTGSADSLAHNGDSDSKGRMVVQNGTLEDTTEIGIELKQLSRRFDILHSFHEDLASQCTNFVPRDEVEQALRALLGEMKLMKYNSISPDLLRESLKTKASATEVQKLVAALTSALGDIAGKHDVASAVYARCLICDKPVKSLVLAPLTSNRGPRTFTLDRGSPNQYNANGSYYDKGCDKGSERLSLTGPLTPPLTAVGTGSIGSAWGPSTSTSQPPPAHLQPQTHSFTAPSYSSFALMHTTTAAAHSNPTSANLRTSGADSMNDSLISSPMKPRGVTEVTVIRSGNGLPPMQGLNARYLPGKEKGALARQRVYTRVSASAGGGSGQTMTLDTR